MSESSRYSYTGPVDHTIPPNKSLLRNKSVIVTGGANGMGEELVRQFAASGSHVTFGDINEARGKEVENEISQRGGKAMFILCDTTSWEDQVRMFDAAIANSPHKSCDVVIANAGISRSSGDSLWKLDGKKQHIFSGDQLLTTKTDPKGPPTKPSLSIVDVNLYGTLYTFKLAVHYFRKQPESPDRDRSFIMTGSMTTYIDSPAGSSYAKLLSRSIADGTTGKLGVYLHKVRLARPHADGAAIERRTRRTYQLRGPLLYQECYSNCRDRN